MDFINMFIKSKITRENDAQIFNCRNDTEFFIFDS